MHFTDFMRAKINTPRSVIADGKTINRILTNGNGTCCYCKNDKTKMKIKIKIKKSRSNKKWIRYDECLHEMHSIEMKMRCV